MTHFYLYLIYAYVKAVLVVRLFQRRHLHHARRRVAPVFFASVMFAPFMTAALLVEAFYLITKKLCGVND